MKLITLFVSFITITSSSVLLAQAQQYKKASSPLFGFPRDTFISSTDYDQNGEACLLGNVISDMNGGGVVFGKLSLENLFNTNDRLDSSDTTSEYTWIKHGSSISTFVARVDINGNLRSWNLISPMWSAANVAANRFGCHVFVDRAENRRYAIGQNDKPDYTYQSGARILQFSAATGKLNWSKQTVEMMPDESPTSGNLFRDRFIILHRIKSLPDYILSVGKNSAVAHGPTGDMSSIRIIWPSCAAMSKVESNSQGQLFFEVTTKESACALGKLRIQKGTSIVRYNLQLKQWDFVLPQEQMIGLDYKERLVTKKLTRDQNQYEVETVRRYEASLISVFEKQLELRLIETNGSFSRDFRDNFAGQFLWRHGGCYNDREIAYKLQNGESKVHNCKTSETVLLKMDENFNIVELKRYQILDSFGKNASVAPVSLNTQIAYSAKTDSMMFTISAVEASTWGIKSLDEAFNFFPNYEYDRNDGPIMLILSTK